MNGNIHNSRGSSTRALTSAARWRMVFIAMVLVLAIGSAGQPALAQGSRERILSTELRTTTPREICVGETVTIQVTAKRVVEFPATGNVKPFTRPEIDITASVDARDSEIVTFLGESEFLGLEGGSSFSFRGEKVGSALLVFTAVVSLVKGEVAIGSTLIEPNKAVTKSQVNVINCKFKVKTLLNFYPGIYDITVISDNAVMTADEQGTFTGSTSMYWVYSNFNLDPCTIVISATDSQVDLTGQLDDDGGQFVATETFQPQSDSGSVTCPGGSGGGTFGFIVNPLTFSVASSGGISTQTVTAGNLSGTATIVVIPEEDEAAALIPGDHEASVGSPFLRWATQWNVFTSLFGALLALP